MADKSKETDEERATREAEEDVKLEERVGKIVDVRVNKAISSHLKRELPKLGETISALVLSKLKPAGDEDGDQDGEGGETGGEQQAQGGQRSPDGKFKGKVDPELDRRMRALEKETAAAKKRAEEAEKKQAEMEARRRTDEENDLSQKALLALGIKDDVQLEAALMFHRGKGRIARDEDGKPVFVRRDKDGDEERVPLDQGLREWGKSDEAKRFLPATGAGGSGNAGGGNGRISKRDDGKLTDEQFGLNMMNLMLGGGSQQQ
jgi:hypothetical protein